MFKNFGYCLIFLFQLGWSQKTEENLVFLANFYTNQQNWEQLEKLEYRILASNNADLFSTLGKLYYSKNDLKKAEKYFKQSYQINKNREIDLEYFFTLYLQGYVQEANFLRKKLSTANLNYTNIHFPQKTMNYLALGGGIKVIEDKNLGGNLNYGSLMMGLNLTSQTTLDIGGNYISQKINQGDLKQQEAHLGAFINIKNYFQIIPAIHFTQATYNGISDNTNYEGKSNFYNGSLSISKRIRNFTISPNIGYIFGKNEINYTFDQSITQKAFQYGLGLHYKLKLSQNLYWTISPSFYQINQNNRTISKVENSEDETSEDIKGQAIAINTTFYYKKFILGFDYLKKDNNLFSLYHAKYFYNFPGEIKYNLSSTLGYQINSNFNLYITAQKEQNIRTYDNLSFNYNNYFLTLIYKF